MHFLSYRSNGTLWTCIGKKRNKQSCNPIFSLLIHTDFQFFPEIYIAVPNKLRAYTWECQGQLLTLGKVRRARYDIKRTPARSQKAKGKHPQQRKEIEKAINRLVSRLTTFIMCETPHKKSNFWLFSEENVSSMSKVKLTNCRTTLVFKFTRLQITDSPPPINHVPIGIRLRRAP